MNQWSEDIKNIFDRLPDIEYIDKKKFRVCYECKQTKRFKEFKKNYTNPSGYGYKCKKCESKYHKEYYKELHPKSMEKQLESIDNKNIFKIAFGHAKHRKRADPNLSWKDAKLMAKEQDYKCALTGVPLNLIKNNAWNLLTPSIDRIDNSKGYEIDNIRWVSTWANIAKNRWTDEEFYEMCKAATEYHYKIISETLESKNLWFFSGKIDINT